jgi:hypothetical protein
MSLSSETNDVNEAMEANADEAPLLSDDGRKFLDGKINAEVYAEMVHRAAAAHARLELSTYLKERRRVRRGTVLTILVGAATAYAILGVVTLGSKDNVALSALAFSTAGLTLVISAFYRWFRDDHDHHEGDRMVGSFLDSTMIRERHGSRQDDA